jgi:hypothetical protein
VTTVSTDVLTRTQEVLEEIGAPELLQDIARGGHWSTSRIVDGADWCNLAKMASIGLVICSDLSEPSTWLITPKGRRTLRDWAR